MLYRVIFGIVQQNHILQKKMENYFIECCSEYANPPIHLQFLLHFWLAKYSLNDHQTWIGRAFSRCYAGDLFMRVWYKSLYIYVIYILWLTHLLTIILQIGLQYIYNVKWVITEDYYSLSPMEFIIRYTQYRWYIVIMCKQTKDHIALYINMCHINITSILPISDWRLAAKKP